MRIVLFVIALAASVSASAQPLYQVTPARTYGAKDTTKKERVFLIFWSAARKEFPPLPFNPFPELPVYDAGTNNFIYDDREVDYPALESAMAKERAQTEAEAKAAALAKDAGGGMALMSMSGWLRLGLPVHDGTNLLLTILGAEEGARHDIYFSTNLSQWSYLFRTATNQTNLTIPPPSASMCFFQLGTLQDLDEDTLPDAYENLITQTDPNAADTPATAGSNTNLAALLTDKPPEIFFEVRVEGLWF